MSILEEMSTLLQQGRAMKVKELAQQAIDDGIAPEQILQEGLLSGMSIIGEKFKNNEVFVPQVLVAARAMNMAVEVLKPHMQSGEVGCMGKIVLGTVKGDLHDIGKNLVKMMLEGKNLTVYDLGVDVSAEAFIEKAIETGADIIGLSALLTTTMGEMKNVVEKAVQAGIRDKVKIMIGGAPVNESFCESIGADYYTPDAASAADVALQICKSAHEG